MKIEMKPFDITYHSTRKGQHCIRKERFMAINRTRAIKALNLWRGATKMDVIDIETKGKLRYKGVEDATGTKFS